MMKQTKLLLLIALIVFGIGFALWSRRKSQPLEAPVGASAPLSRAPTITARPDPSATPNPAVQPTRKFADLGIMERNALLMEIKKQDLAEIFRLWREANRVEQDLMKQGAIATTLAYALREKQPTPELVEEMRQFTADGANSLRERGAVLGIFGGAKTKEAVNFLLQAITTLEDKELRRIALAQITGIGALWGDGSYHEERSPALEQSWRDSRDPDLLIAAAVAMAQIGAPTAIESLLSAALMDDGTDDLRKRAALGALEKVYTRNAVPAVAARLATQPASAPTILLTGGVLVAIGDTSAAKALLGWLQSADASAAMAARTFVVRTRTPELLTAWSAAVESKTVFRSEEIREAIRAGLMEYNQNRNSSR